MKKILLIGATGLVGTHVLQRLIASEDVANIVAPCRRPLASHGKLHAPVVDFDALPTDAAWWNVDAVISAIGTTIAKAGSREAFRKVDLDLPLTVARLARNRGASCCVAISAHGASPSALSFYSRTKGALEDGLSALGFPSLTLVRPTLIGGDRQESRPMERVSIQAIERLGRLVPQSLRVNPASRIADAIVDAAIAGKPGTHVVTSREMCE